MTIRSRARRATVYAWAGPTTAVGLLAGAITLATGGHVHRRRGALEFHGGFSRWFLQRRAVAASAMTLGHVILGRDVDCLDWCRDHEQAHVRQVERWGMMFLPAYVGSSFWEWAQGRHYYRDNWFERDARAACGEDRSTSQRPRPRSCPMLKAVIFDVDGTLIDSVDAHGESWRKVLANYGFNHPFELVRNQIGKGGDELMKDLMPADAIEELGDKIEEERSELFKAEFLPDIKAFPKTRELFQKIEAAGLRIVLASSAKGDELESYKKLARIDDLIEEATSSDDAERSKPNPDIFLAAMKKLEGVQVGEAVVVGDSPYDAIAAGKAGLRTIGLLCGGFPEAELRKAGCMAIYRDPADLLAHYDESPLGGD